MKLLKVSFRKLVIVWEKIMLLYEEKRRVQHNLHHRLQQLNLKGVNN